MAKKSRTTKKRIGRPPSASPDDPKENKSVNLSMSEVARLEEAMEVISEKKLGAFIRTAALDYADRILGKDDKFQELIDAVARIEKRLNSDGSDEETLPVTKRSGTKRGRRTTS